MKLLLCVIATAVIITTIIQRNGQNNNNNNYIYFTPGPLSTTDTVREFARYDYSSRDKIMQKIIKNIRNNLLEIYNFNTTEYSTILFPGSGTFAIESVISSYPFERSILLLNNGYYSERIHDIIKKYNKTVLSINNVNDLIYILHYDTNYYFSDVIMVHCETSTGIVNNLELVQKHIGNRGLIVDAMSSFAGVHINPVNISFIISASGKCIQSSPGISFIIGNKNYIKKCRDTARTYSLDLYKQWEYLENKSQFPYTPPVGVLASFNQAIKELFIETLSVRIRRYNNNHIYLINFMKNLGFKQYTNLFTPIITVFYYPTYKFNFTEFYDFLYNKNLVIYPGSFVNNTFRIGTIGNINKLDLSKLKLAIEQFFK